MCSCEWVSAKSLFTSSLILSISFHLFCIVICSVLWKHLSGWYTKSVFMNENDKKVSIDQKLLFKYRILYSTNYKRFFLHVHAHKHPSIPLCRDKGMHQNSHTSPHNHLLSSCLHVCDCVQRPKNNASQVFIFHSLPLCVVTWSETKGRELLTK